MADITMCNNLMCPAAGDCKRVQATLSEHWQSCSTWVYKETDGVIQCTGYILYKTKKVIDNYTRSSVAYLHRQPSKRKETNEEIRTII